MFTFYIIGRDVKINSVFFLISNSDDLKIVSIMSYELSQFNLMVDGVEIISENEKDIKGIIDVMIPKIKGAVFSLLSGNISLEFFKLFKEKGIDSNSHPIMSLTLTNQVLQNLEMYENHLFFTYKEHSEEDAVDIYLQLLSLYFFKYKTYSNYLILAVFEETISSSNAIDSLDGKEILEHIRTSSKKINICKNNYISSILYMYTVKDNELVLYYKSPSAYIPNPWDTEMDNKESYRICDWEEKMSEKIEYPIFRFNLLCSLGGEQQKKYTSIISSIYGFIKDSNDKGDVNGYYLSLRMIDMNSKVENVLPLLKKLEIKDIDVGFFGCVTSKCREILSDYFEGSDKFYWYMGSNEGEICKRNTMYPGKVLSQFIYIMRTIIQQKSQSKNIYVVGTIDSRTSNTIYSSLDVIFADSEYKVIKKLLDAEKESADAYIQDLMINAIPESIIIDTSEDEMSKIFGISYDHINWKGNLEILKLDCPLDLYELQSASFDGVMCLSSSNYENNRTMYQESMYKHTMMNDIDEYSENLAISSEIMKCGLEKSKSLKFNEIRAEIQNCEYNSTSGNIYIHSSNYFNRRIFLYKRESKKWLMQWQQADLIVPKAYNWEYSYNYGRLCNHLDDTIGSNGTSPFISILLAFFTSGERSELDLNLQTSMESFIENINREGGLLGLTLNIQFLDVLSENQCYSLLLPIINRYNVIFTTVPYSCLQRLSNQIEEKKILIFILTLSISDTCHPNIMLSGRIPSLFEQIINDLIYKYGDFAIIGMDTDYTRSFVTFVTEFLTFYSTKNSYVLLNSQNSLDWKNIFDGLKFVMSEGMIVFFGSGNDLKSILDYISENEMKYEIISMLTGEDIIIPKEKYYIFSGYDSELKNIENENIKKQLKIMNGENYLPTEEIVLGYSVLKMWSMSVKATNTLDTREVQLNLYKSKYSSPFGETQFFSNNMLKRFYFYKLIENGKIESISNNLLFAANPNPYYYYKLSQEKSCDMITYSFSQTVLTVKIAVIVSLHGDWSNREKPYVSVMKYAVDQINLLGGVNQYTLVPIFVDVNSEESSALYSTEMLNRRDDIAAIFTSLSNEIIEKLEKSFLLYNTLLYSSGMTPLEQCNRNIISIGPLTSLHVYLFRSMILPKFNEIILMREESKVSSNIVDLLTIELNNKKKGIKSVYDIKEYQKIIELQNISNESIPIVVAVHPHTIENYISELCGINNLILFSIDERIIPKEKEGCYKNMKVITNYVNDLSSKNSKYFTNSQLYDQLYSIYGSDFVVTSEAESGYESIYAWKTAVENLFTFEPDVLRYGLYGIEYTTPSGIVRINSDNYFSHRMFIAGYDIKKGLFTEFGFDDIIEPEVWNPELNDNKYYICDWNINNEKLLKESKSIGIILQSVTKEMDKQSTVVQLMITLGVDNINSLGGISDYLLLPHFQTGNTREEIVSINELFGKKYEISLLIGCFTVECLEISSSYLNGQYMFYYLGMNNGRYCHPDVLMLSSPTTQHIKGIIENSMKLGFKILVFIGSKSSIYLYKNY